MKQKYKVFINDQEIVFQSVTIGINPNQTVLPENLSPLEIYSDVIHNDYKPEHSLVIPCTDPLQSISTFKAHFPQIEAAGGLVRLHHPDGDLLMIFRLGKWDLPKGKIEPNESQEEAAIREVSEECGITNLNIVSNLGTTYHMYEHKGQPVLKITYWFMMITADNRIPVPQVDEGISEVRWVAINEIKTLLPECYQSIAALIETAVLH